MNSTLNLLRNSGYWLPKGRFIIKKVLAECITCKRMNAFSFTYPKRTDFISDKVNFFVPYQNTGVDFTSHFFVKIGDATKKFYIVIFTCLNIRSVHLELIPSMSTSDFLLALTKFCNFYVITTKLYSDNASTFIHALKLLNNCHLDDPLKEYMERNSIQHVRIPLYSPWVGNAWERLIRVVKSCLYKTIGKKKLDFFQFSSLLVDIQNIVNSRPLTYDDNSIDNLTVISPNHFLKLSNYKNINFSSLDQSDLEFPSRNELVKTLTHRDELFSNLRSMWYESYLLSLREQSKDMYQADWVDRIKVGDIVLIHSDVRPRPEWPLGRVTRLLTGADGRTRSVKLVRGGSVEEVHSVQLLYPLELSLLTDEKETSPDNIPDQEIARPVRASAIKCKEKLKYIK